MRLRFKPTSEQRFALRTKLVRLDEPAAVREVLRSILPAEFKLAHVVSTVQSVHADRFVTRVLARSVTGEERAYAFKVYSDDFAEQVWEHSQAVAKHPQPEYGGLCTATHYLANERLLVFPWVEGAFLSEVVDERKPELLQVAAKVAADVHRLPLVPEELTTAQMLFDEARARCARLLLRWPQHREAVERTMAALEEALPLLDPAEPAPVHGDMAAAQFLWTGDRLVLLDLDMFGYCDPAYDVGHFLAQLERRCLVDSDVENQKARWLSALRDTYLAEMPSVSPRNVAFYRGLTLIRKLYTLCRRGPAEARFLPQLAECARAALHEAASPELVR